MGSKKGKLLALVTVIVMLVALGSTLLLTACQEDSVTLVFDAGQGTFESGSNVLTVTNLKPGATIDLKNYIPTNGNRELREWQDEDLNSYKSSDTFTVPNKANGTVRLTAVWRSGSGSSSIDLLSAILGIVGGISKGDRLTTVLEGSGIAGGKNYGIKYVSNVSRGTGENALDFDLGIQFLEDGAVKLGIYSLDIQGAPGGLFIDTNPSDPAIKPIYIEDVNFDYILSVADKLPGFVDNLLSTGAIGSYKGIISMVLGMFMSGSATKNGSVTDYSITISPRKLVNLKDLLGILGGALANLPIDINALMSWLDENIPNVDFTINASLNSQGAFVGNPSMQVVDNTNGESTFTFNTSTLKITSWDGSNSSNLDSIVPDYISDYTTWSLGNIKFSVNLDAATSSGAVDVGALINTFVPGTLPQNLIILDLSLGYRLDFILDLDIKQENPAEDKNIIALELFEKGKTGAGNAVLGVYHRNGSLYVNIGGILNNLPAASGNGQISRLWDGKGIKIDGIRLNELISALKERVVKEIDNLFGTDHGKIEQRNAESSMSLLQEYDSIMALSVDGNGDTYIAPGWGNFISMLFKVLKVEGDYVNVTNGENGGTLSITINNNLIDSVLAAVKGFGVNLPEGFAIPDIGEGELYIKVNNSGLDSIGLNHSIGGIDLSLSLSDFLLLKPITFNDGDMQIELCEYVDSCIGEAGNYTTSINELLMDVLYGGIKGSINLDLSFSGGEYNISQLLSMFGLSLGDIKLIVDNPNAKIALGLDFGFYIDEENPDENSSLYLELVAREPVYLENPVGGNAILDEGIILGIYLYKNALYLDASHLKILNLQMPIYKMDNMGIGSFIEALLAQLADINLSLDMSGVIDAIRGSNTPDNGEQEAAAALADITSNSNGVLRTSQTISTQSAISLYLGSDAVKLSATVSAVFALLEAFNVNLGIDISKYVSGEIPLEIQYKDGALSLSVSGNILPTVDGKDSNLSLQLGIDLADINIAGCKQEIADKVDGVGSSYDDGLNDNLIEGILNAVLDTQISVGVTLRQGKLDVLKLVDYLLDVLNVSVSLSDLDVNGSISADSLDVTLNIKLAMSNASNPLLGLDLVSTESGREETLLGFYLDKDNAYINLAMLGLGKYKVSNTGLMGIITDLLDSIGSEITLKGLLGIDNLLDLGKSLNAKVVESDIYGRYIAWNRYGQASDIRYTVYGIGEGSNGEQTQTDLFGSFSHNDTAKFADGKFKIDLSAEEYDVYSAFKIVVFTVKDGGNKVLLSATAVPEQFDYSATAEYADAAATTVRFNVFDKGYTYRLQKNAGNGFVDVNIDAAVIDGTFEIVLDGTGVTAYKVIISGANNVKIDEFEIIPTQVQPEEIAKSGLSVNINDEQKLVSWSAEEGAEYYEVSLTEKGAAAPSWTTRVSSVNNLTTRWYSDYKYYTVTVVAYSAEGEVLNSGSSSTSYNVIDAILSGLTIKNGVIGLDITGKIFGDIFANLIGEQYRIEILNVSLSDVNIFTGTANLSLSIFDSVGPDAGSITLDASLSISPTDTVKLNSDINAMNAPNSEYAEIDLAYGGNVVRGIWDIFEEGVMLGAQFELAFAKGSYDLSNLFTLLGGDIAKIFEAGPVWTFTEDTSIKVDLSAAVIMDDVNTISPEGQDKLPEGMLKAPQIMVSLAFPDGLVLGSNVAIKKGESVDIFLNYDGLGIDLSGLTILGLTLPRYKAEFDFFGFLNKYLLQLESMIGDQYNPAGLEASVRTVDEGGKAMLQLSWKPYMGADGYSYVINNASGSSAPVRLGNITETKIDISAFKAGDSVTLNALDTMGYAYKSVTYYAKNVGGKLEFELNGISAHMAKASGDDVSISINKDKLSLMITSQALFDIIELVTGKPIEIDLPDLNLTVNGALGNIDGLKGLMLSVVGDLIKPQGYTGAAPTLEVALKLFVDSGEAVRNLNIGNRYLEFLDSAESAGSKLISGLLDTVLGSSFSLYIDLAADTGFDIIDILNMFVGNIIDISTLNIDTVINGTQGNKLLELKLTPNGSYSDFDNISLMMQLIYSGKEMIALFIKDGDAYLDMSGIGVGAVKLTDSNVSTGTLVAQLKGILDSYINKIDIDIAKMLNDLLNPTQTAMSESGVNESQDDAAAAPAVNTSSLIGAIIEMVSLNDSIIKLNATAEMINGLLNQFFAISANITLDGDIDLFNGKADVSVSIRDSQGNALTLGMGLSISPVTQDERDSLNAALEAKVASFNGVVIDVDNITASAADLFNSLSVSLELDVNFDAADVNLWDVLGVVLKELVKSDDKTVSEIFDALGESGVHWVLDAATEINLKLGVAADIRTKKVNGKDVIDEEGSSIVVALKAGSDISIGYDAADANREVLMYAGDAIYIIIKGGKLYIDLSALHILGLTLPVLRADTFEVIPYINNIVNDIENALTGILPRNGVEGLSDMGVSAPAVNYAALARDADGSIVIGEDITFNIGVKAILSLLSGMGLLDLTALDINWDIVATTGVQDGQLQLAIRHNGEGTPLIGLDASLTLGIKLNDDQAQQADAYRAQMLEKAESAEEDYANSYSNVVNAIFDKVLNSTVKLSFGADTSDGGKFNMSALISRVLRMIVSDAQDIDDSYQFNLDVSDVKRYELSIGFDGKADDIAGISAIIRLDSVTEDNGNESVSKLLAIYINNGNLYADLSALIKNINVIKISNSAIMDMLSDLLGGLLSGINLDLNELLKLEAPKQETKSAALADSDTKADNTLDIAALVKSAAKLVRLHNSSLVLDAQAAAIDELLYTLAGIHLDIVDVSGAIYLINGKIELGAKIYDGIPTSAGVNSLNISLGIALSENSEERVAQMRAEIAEIDANAVELDFTNGKTLSQTVMNVLGGLSLKLDVKLTLPEGVFGVGNLLKSFGIDIADTNAFELVISGGNMQLDASLVAKAAFDYNNPNNTVVMLEIVMNSDAVFGGYDGESNVVFHAGDTVMGIYIKGSELYVDLSNFTLLGIEFPVYYTDNFNIQGFINYLLDKTIGNLDSTLFGEFAVSANYGATATEFAWAKEEGADAYMIKLNGVALSRISAYGADGSVSEKYTYSIDNSKLSGVYNVEVVPMVKKVTETDGKEQVNYVDLGKRIGRYTNKFDVNISRDSDNNVIFGWNRISGVDYYAILLNGNQVATVTKTEWVSSELTGGETISVIPYKYSSDKYVRVNDYIGIAQYSVTQPEVSKAATLDSLGENELLLLGVSRDQINMTVSLSAIQTIMSALNMDVSLGEYVGVIDLTFKPSEDWLSISFEGLLGDAYGGEVTKGELALSVFDIYNGSNAEQFKRELHGLDVWNALSEKKDSAYRNIVDGLLEKILNLSGTIDISVTGDTALNMSNIFNHIFAQIPELADMNFAEDIMLELAGLNLQLALNLGIDIDSVENTVVAVELNDTTNGLDTLLGIYVYQGKLIIDASGIAFGKYSVEGTALFNSLFDMVGDLVKGLRDATDMDGLMDMIYGLLEPKSDDNSSVAVADEGMRGNMPEGSHSIGVRVSVNANEGTTTFSWDSVPNAMRYRLSVYSGYDLATKTNILGNGGLVPVGNTVIDDNFTIRENSITFKTEELNAIGLVKDSMSAFDGILQSGYYYFVVEAVRIRGENTVVPLYDDDGKVLNGVYTNFNVIKTILGMVKIKNDKISLTATAGMLNKLLAGALGINLDWISLILDIDLFDGVGNLDIEISDGKKDIEADAWVEINQAGVEGVPASANISWQAVEGANSYTVSVTNGAGSTSVITIDADNTSYTFIGEGDNEWLNSTTQAALSGTVTSDDGTIASNIVIRYTAKSAAVNGIATIKWNVVEGAASYKIEMTDWSGKYGIETINVSADSLNVVDGVASLSVTGPNSDKWLNNPDNLRYRVTASFEGVNTAVLGLGIAISSEGREKAVAAMKRNNLLVQQDDSEDLEVSPEIPSINEWSGVSIQQFVEGLLSKIRLEASLDIFIARGNYNISELINNILEKLNVNIEGLDESGIVWSLTDDLRFNLELQLLFSLGENAEDTKLVLELSSSGLSFNDGEGGVLGVINPGVLLGLYYQNGKAFIDLSNVTLLGIQMPCYTFDIEVYTLIKDVIDSLFVDFDFGPIGSGLDVKTQSNSSGEVFAKWNAHSKAAEYKVEVFEPVYNEDNKEFAQWRSAGVKSVPAGVTMTDITALIGDNSYYKLDVTALDSDGNVIVTASVTIGDTQSGNTVALNGDTDGISMKNLLLLGISSERLHIQATTKAVASLLSTFLSGNATVSMISDLLGMFDIAISGEWKSKEALTLKLQGDLFQNNNYTPVKTVCGGVEYKVSDSGATFSWDEYGLASSYNLVIRDSLNRVVADVVSDTNSVFVPFDSNFTVATLAPNGGSWNAYAVMNTPLNIMAKLHTEKLLNTEDMDKVSADIDSALSRVDIDAAMEKYSSKLIAGLLDKVYNIALGVQLDFGSVDKFSLSEVLSIMVGDMLLGAAGLSVGELTDAFDIRLSTDATVLGLDVMLNVDRINPANTNIAIEISSAIGGGIKDVLFAVYIYNARIIIDMRAIGLRAYEIRNLEYVVDLQKQLFELIDGLVGSLEVDISELLNGLIKPDPSVVATQDNLNSDETLGEADTAISVRMVNSHNAAGERVTTVKWNAVNGADSYRLTMPDADGNETIFTCADTYYSFVSDADVYTKPYNVKVEALDADGTPISESVRGANGVIASLLNAISLQNSIIRLDVTSEILDTILATLLPNVSINMDPLELLQAKVDIFNGNANARIDLVIKQSDTGAVVNEFNLGATLSLKMADKLYSVDELTGNPDPDTVIQQAITGMGSNGLNIVDLGQGDMAGRIVNALLTAVGTTSLKAEIAVGFNAGTYDLAALISSFGLDILGDANLYWTFRQRTDIKLAIELSVRIATNAQQDSLIMLDIKAVDRIFFPSVNVNGNNYGEVSINAGESLISIFGRSNANGTSSIYLDLSGFEILGIPLPILKAEYSFDRMIINEVYDLVAKLTGQGVTEVSYAQDSNGNMVFSWDEKQFAGEQIKYDLKITGADNDALIADITDGNFNLLNGKLSYVLTSGRVMPRMNVKVTAYYNYTMSDGRTARRIVADGTTLIDLNAVAEVVADNAEDVVEKAEQDGLQVLDTMQFAYTGLNTAEISWIAIKDVVAYEVYIEKVGSRERLALSAGSNASGKITVRGDGALTSYATYGINANTIQVGDRVSINIDTNPLFNNPVSAYNTFAGAMAFAPVIGNVNSANDYYGYYVVVNCYGSVAQVEEEETPAVGDDSSYALIAKGAVNSYKNIIANFIPQVTSSAVEGYYNITWAKIAGAVNYSVLPYYVYNSVTTTGESTEYRVVGKKNAFTSFIKTDMITTDNAFGLYNVNYSGTYNIEVGAYDSYGNLLGYVSMENKTQPHVADKLMPMAMIEVIAKADQLGIAVGLDAVGSILNAFGVKLGSFDLTALDLDALIGLSTSVGKVDRYGIDKNVNYVSGVGVDGFTVDNLSSGERYLVKVTHTNDGGAKKEYEFALDTGLYTTAKVNFPMTALGTYNYSIIQGQSNEVVNITFRTFKTFALSIVGDLMPNVDTLGAEITELDNRWVNASIDGDKIRLTWDAVNGTSSYRVEIEYYEDINNQLNPTDKASYTSAAAAITTGMTLRPGNYIAKVTFVNGESAGKHRLSMFVVTQAQTIQNGIYRLGQIGLSTDGKLIYWNDMSDAQYYSLSIKEVDNSGALIGSVTYDNLIGTVHSVGLNKVGEYDVVVRGYDADGNMLSDVYMTHISATGASDFSLGVNIDYDNIVIGGADDDYRQLSEKISRKENSYGATDYASTVRMLLFSYLEDASIKLNLGLEATQTVLDISSIINKVFTAISGKALLGAPVRLDVKGINGMGLELNVAWHLGYNRDASTNYVTGINMNNTSLKVELKYNEGSDSKILLGLYLKNRTFYVALQGLGLFNLRLTSNRMISNLTQTLYRTIDELTQTLDNTIDGALGTDTGVGINFSTLIKSLLGEYPQIDLGSVITGGNSVLGADELAATAEDEQSANLDMGYIVAKLLGVISLENSALMIKATSSVLDSLMTDLLGVTLGLDVDLNLLLGILNGDIAASLRLDNITVNAELELNINDGNDYGNFNIPDMQFINMDVEQSTGTQMAISLLQNSGLNLTMDIVNANVESLAYYNYQTETYKYGYPNTVRAGIEILSADRQITDNLNSKAYISAKAGGILVTLYNIDTAEYNTKGSGNKTALLHVYIGPDDTLTVALCKGIFVASAKWALSTFIVDLGDGISGSGLSGIVGGIVGDVIPLVIRSSGLGLMNTLGGLLDNIIDMLIGDKAEAEETPSNPGTGDTSSGTGTIVSDFNIRVVKSAQNLNPAVDGDASFRVIHSNSTDASGTPYDYYQMRIVTPDGRVLLETAQYPATSGVSVGNGRYDYGYNVNSFKWYSDYIVEVTGGIYKTGFAKIGDELDLWALLGGEHIGKADEDNFGITASLSGTGNFNLSIDFDTYYLNKLVDDVMDMIFGVNCILDLTTVSIGGGVNFRHNYLQHTWWDRTSRSVSWINTMDMGSDGSRVQMHYDAASTLDSIGNHLPGLLADLFEMIGINVQAVGINVSAATLREDNSIIEIDNTLTRLGSVLVDFLPFAVWNTARLNVNLVDGTIANISFDGEDTGAAVKNAAGEVLTHTVYTYYSAGYDGSRDSFYFKQSDGGTGRSDDYTYSGHNNKGGIRRLTSGGVVRTVTSIGNQVLPHPAATYTVSYGAYNNPSEGYNTGGMQYSSASSNVTGRDGGRMNFNFGYVRTGSTFGNRSIQSGIGWTNGAPSYGSNQLYTIGQNGVSPLGTKIDIYNGSASVGSSSSTTDGSVGITSWAGLPAYIEYDPKSMGSGQAAAATMMSRYFVSGLTARYQQGSDFARGQITYTLDGATLTAGALATKLNNSSEFTVVANAAFASGAKQLSITIRKNVEALASIDKVQMHYYDAMPAYIVVTTVSGKRKRYDLTTDTTEYNKGNKVLLTNFKPSTESYAQSNVVTGNLRFADGTTNNVLFEIEYLDSSVDMNNRAEIDLYRLSDTDRIVDEISDIRLKYADGNTIVSDDLVLGYNNTSGSDNYQIYSVNKGRLMTINDWGKDLDINGDRIIIPYTLKQNAAVWGSSSAMTQEGILTIDIPSKIPEYITVGQGEGDSLVIRPYDHYMSLVNNDNSLAALPSNVTAHYSNGTSEVVSVRWRSGTSATSYIYSNNLVSGWNTMGRSGVVYVENNEVIYSTNMHWAYGQGSLAQRKVSYRLMSGRITDMAFDRNGDGDYRYATPERQGETTALVTFSGGYTMVLPTIITTALDRDIAYIGYDVAAYRSNNLNITNYSGYEFKQGFWL